VNSVSLGTPLKEDRARRYIAALMERAHALRQPRSDEGQAEKSTGNDLEENGEYNKQNPAIKVLSWLRNRL
jgi:hypothetical protein